MDFRPEGPRDFSAGRIPGQNENTDPQSPEGAKHEAGFNSYFHKPVSSLHKIF
jgi:hypothetical protein